MVSEMRSARLDLVLVKDMASEMRWYSSRTGKGSSFGELIWEGMERGNVVKSMCKAKKELKSAQTELGSALPWCPIREDILRRRPDDIRSRGDRRCADSCLTSLSLQELEPKASTLTPWTYERRLCLYSMNSMYVMHKLACMQWCGRRMHTYYACSRLRLRWRDSGW